MATVEEMVDKTDIATLRVIIKRIVKEYPQVRKQLIAIYREYYETRGK